MCNLTFASVKSYRVHMGLIHPYVTNEINTHFLSQTSFQAEACQVPSCNCGKNKVNQHFSNESAIKVDKSFMISKINYTCIQCRITFPTPKEYTRHLVKMHCAKVYKCQLCKAQTHLFDNLRVLKDHYYSIHGAHEFELFQCRLCKQTDQFHVTYRSQIELSLIHI